MTVIVVLHLTIDWHHSEWLGTVYDYDYNRTDPTDTAYHYRLIGPYIGSFYYSDNDNDNFIKVNTKTINI